MKRAISLLLVAVMMLGLLAGCGEKAPAAEDNNVAMQYIKAEEAKELLESDEYVFFDIRKAADSSANSIPGAQAWDMDAAKEGDAEAGKATMTEATKGLDKKIILVCYSGKRYAQAATNALSAIGYDMSKVFTLEGGFTNWNEKLPELTTAAAAEVATVRTDLVLYESADIDTLDPMETKTGAGTKLAGLQYEGLIKYMYEYAADGSTVFSAKPNLAENWVFDAENMTVTFNLKKEDKIGFVGENEIAVMNASNDVLMQLKKHLNNDYKGEKIITLGPMPSRVAKVNEKYRYRLIIKCRNSKRFRELISEILIKTSTDSRFSGVTVYADINPDSTV